MIKPVISDSSVGKESACNTGDPGSVPKSGRSPGEGIGYRLQDSWASLVTQLVKNLPATWETWVLSLGWEDPLEKGKATHSSILAWRIPWTCPRAHKESDMTEPLSFSLKKKKPIITSTVQITVKLVQKHVIWELRKKLFGDFKIFRRCIFIICPFKIF